MAATIRISLTTKLAQLIPSKPHCIDRFSHISTSTTTHNSEDFSDQDQADAREWLNRFNPNTISRDLGDISFSRSSGPGGQNVNK